MRILDALETPRFQAGCLPSAVTQVTQQNGVSEFRISSASHKPTLTSYYLPDIAETAAFRGGREVCLPEEVKRFGPVPGAVLFLRGQLAADDVAGALFRTFIETWRNSARRRRPAGPFGRRHLR